MRHVFVLAFCLLTLSESCDVKKWNPFLNRNSPHIAALILARGGSRGIPLKNLSKVGETAILSRSIREVLKVGSLTSLWVSTDHNLIYAEAAKNGVNIHWRSKESATDEASSLSAIQEFLSKHLEVEVVVLVQCTSPFVKAKYLQDALVLLRDSDELSQCIFSVSRSFDLRWIEETPGGSVSPLNFEPEHRPRRQDWNGELIENGMFYVASRRLIQRGVLQTDSCKVVEIPNRRSLQIDDPWDLEVANRLLELFDDN